MRRTRRDQRRQADERATWDTTATSAERRQADERATWDTTATSADRDFGRWTSARRADSTIRSQARTLLTFEAAGGAASPCRRVCRAERARVTVAAGPTLPRSRRDARSRVVGASAFVLQQRSKKLNRLRAAADICPLIPQLAPPWRARAQRHRNGSLRLSCYPCLSVLQRLFRAATRHPSRACQALARR